MPAAPTDTSQSLGEVSTEAQLAELNKMSDRLREKLEDMILEQSARVQEFTERQHSLSSLPGTPQPQYTPPAAPSWGQPADTTYTARPAMPVRPTKPVPPTKPAAPQPPPLATTRQQERQETPQPAYTAPARPARPATKRTAEEPGSYGWLITVGIFILIILMRSCE